MILQALSGAYERFAQANLANGKPRVPPYGLSYEKIRYAIVIGRDGALVDIAPVDAQLDVPVDPMTTRTSGIMPMYMWDKTAYVLGLAPDQKKRTAEEHSAFKALQLKISDGSDDPGILAVLRFLSAWQPNRTAIETKMPDSNGANVVFKLDGEHGFVHERPTVLALWMAHLARRPAAIGQCLITGGEHRIALTHPTVGGVRAAQSSGASIVSFNQASFVSYGKAQGANAPVSEFSAFAYTTVLNDLLAKKSKLKIQIGDASMVYWANADTAAAADSAELAAQYLFAPSPADADDAATDQIRRGVMDLIAKGRPLYSPELHLDPGTRFYILGLAPNAARLSVRFWEMTTLGALGDVFYQHWQDLRLETRLLPKPPPALAALALQTAPARKNASGDIRLSFGDVSPLLSGELIRTVLSGGRYPGSLLSTLVMRIRSDGYLGHLRVSLIKAALVRAMRLENRLPQEDYLVRSDPNDPNTARRLGRLFAVLERAQMTALGGDINTTIKDKFLGAAAATPGHVFVSLLKNAQHHTRRLRNGQSDAKWIKSSSHARRAGFGIDRDIGAICETLTDGFPQQHSIEDQGLFLIGYYQERFGGKIDPAIGAEPGVDTPNDIAVNTDDQE